MLINKDSPDYAHTLTMIGKEEEQLGNTQKAIEYFNLAYEVANISDLTLDKVQTLLAIGNVYRTINVRQALKSYQEAEVLAIDIDSNEELRDIYEGMALAYYSTGDYKNAYAYQNKYLDLKDKIFNIETDDKIRGVQFDFEIEKDELVREKRTDIGERINQITGVVGQTPEICHLWYCFGSYSWSLYLP